MAARIPAWKKLGLQLKNAATSVIKTDTALSVIENTSFQSKGTKKRPLTSESEESNGKKPRVENVTINEKTKRENTKENTNDKTPKNKATNPELKLSLESSSVENQDNKLLSKPKSKKRKSVSFAEDTKLEDGDGNVELELENEHEDARDPSPAVARKAEKKKLKREQRAKNRPDSTSNATPIDPTLQYLTLYHKSRAQWKFQKNRETHLLKHALSVDRIPSTYNASLATYLAGIKSEGAKKRVAEAAVEAIKADDADVDSGENGGGGGSDASEKDKYRNSISSFRKLLVGLVAADPHSWEGDMVGDEATDLNADWLKKLERRRRAELALHFVGGSVPAAEAAELQAESRPGVSEKKKQKNQKRKKKNRTNVIEDTSSSSSSSSGSSSNSSETDSDSDSDGDDFNSKPTTEQVSEITKSRINGLHNDSSSSSESEISSSDSSSDSDSDTESETSSNSSSDSDSD
ncbi:proteasome subunit alpha type 6 [Histoplasma ohiense]|nr:proteasome subunit alpha type 6 [Histoplasma ohiense (nom. inval.)]